MKLQEIVNRSFIDYRPGTAAELKETSDFLKNGAELVKELVGRYSVWKKQVKFLGDFYFIQAADEVAGWIGLKPRDLDGRKVFGVDFIYFTDKFRGTKAVPMLLHAVKEQLDAPVMIDSSDAVFKGGAQLISALAKRGMIKLSAVHPDGTTEPIKGLDEVGQRDAVLIEDVAPFSIPGKNLLGQEEGQVLIDWYGSPGQDEFV